MMQRNRFVFASLAAVALTFVVGCAHKKVAKQVPPPPPPVTAPTATLIAQPTTIEPGGNVTLTWQVQNAYSINIGGIGDVSSSGSRLVTPNQSEDFTLVAKGPGGMREASARVTVLPNSVAAKSDASLVEQFNQIVKDIYFDYDRYEIRQDQTPAAQKAAEFLAAHPQLKVTIEGHCDDRGSEEYNLALGDSRARALQQRLVNSGANNDQLKTISYGKEKPFCQQENDQCWQQNRRDHYVLTGQ